MTINQKSFPAVTNPSQRTRGDSCHSPNLEISWPPKFVRLCKVAEAPRPVAPAIAPEDYCHGLLNSAGSLPTLYALDGWLLRLPQVGEVVLVLRFSRNGVIMPGVFTSTEVIDVPQDGEFITRNSIYYWQEIAEPPAERPT